MAIPEIFLLHDVFLPRQEDVRTRIRLSRKAIRENKISRMGAEFFFQKESDLKHADKLAQRSRMFARELRKLGAETYFSVHMPWRPPKAFDLDCPGNKLEDTLKKISELHEVRTINIHPTNDLTPELFRATAGSFDEKLERMKTVAERLRALSKDYNLSIENLTSPSPKEGNINYVGTFPRDLEKILSSAKGASFTLDACHSGITLETCRRILSGESLGNFPGIYQEEEGEIKKYAKLGDYAFLPLAPRMGHMHLSDHDGFEKHGIVPGEGRRSPEELKNIAFSFLKKSRAKEIGIVLEIVEKDYFSCPNTVRAFRAAKEMGLCSD